MESDSSNSDLLINLGIIAAIMVIIMSGMAIVSILRNTPPKERTLETAMADETEQMFDEVVDEELND